MSYQLQLVRELTLAQAELTEREQAALAQLAHYLRCRVWRQLDGEALATRKTHAATLAVELLLELNREVPNG